MPAFRTVRGPVLALSLSLVAAGCTSAGVALATGAAAGAAAIAYVQGDLETELEGSTADVASATGKAFEAMELSLVSSEVGEVDARLEATTARERSVVVHLTGLEDGGTRISIRVGTFGDERVSRRLLERIQDHLDS